MATRAFEPWVYPADLADEVSTPEGTYVVRPIRPEDAAALLAFHHRLSPGSIYRRYFSVHPDLSADELVHLTNVDYVDRLAFVVTRDLELAGVGRYDRLPGTTRAEVAFIVEDAHQHRGLGAALLDHLAAAAWERGITMLIAETLADNRDMMAVFHQAGFPIDSRLTDEVYSVRLAIDPARRET